MGGEPASFVSAATTAANVYLRRCATIDTRTLGLFRIAMALCVLVDLAIRFADLEAHYTDFGTVPTALALAELRPPWRLSFHTLDGGVAFQTALFGLHGLFALSLLVGFWSRTSALLVLVMLVSVEARNGLLAQGGDTYTRCMLFWGMFTPLGARFSLDRRLAGGTPVLARTYSAATVALLMQVVFLYIFTALWKHGDTWLQGDALYYTLYRDQHVHRFSLWLREAPLWALKFGTWFTLVTEVLGPMLLFQPRPAGRVIALVALIGLHIGIFLTVRVGTFSFVCVACLLLFLPPRVWDLVPRFAVSDAVADGAAPWRFHRLRDSIVSALLVYTLIWNIDGLVDARLIPGPLRQIGLTLRIRQQWMMFAPSPPKFDGWWVARATLEGGEHLDLLTGRTASWRKPELISETFTTYRWRKYARRIGRKGYARFRPHWARYLCDNYNRDAPPGKRATNVELWHLKQRIRRDRTWGETKRRKRLSYTCS